MKKIALIAAMAAALASSFSAQAASVNGAFNVVLNLTSACEITTAPGQITINYTSFQTGPATGNTTFDVRCTTNLPYNLSLGTASTTEGAGFGSQTAGSTTALNYDLTVTDGVTRVGNGLTGRTHTITGTAAADQSGTCALPTCSDTIGKTVFINY